ncbi:MAG TPA: patatin-like phospholipase family protein, partial [Vicinamibacterales bacterium]|nr:patatin-like phospholipase family protein [Vicinamibacterales bacterium]
MKHPHTLASAALRTLLVARLCYYSGVALAQTPGGPEAICAPDPAGRPAVGLVLSGGGARGGAHIGVLKALDELRVPIDCIAGTSVGAVIGGFYAAGLSPVEIEEIALTLDWQSALLNTTPRSDRSFRRKRDDHLFLIEQRPGLKGGRFALPTGLVQGQIIDMILTRATQRAYAVRDFDALDPPFRAVATDISTGEAVELRSGDLATALRASMSLPGLMTPIDIDGRMLSDGGLATNLPVAVAQSMGADVVIAVDVTSALLTRDQIRSVLDVVNQVTTLMTLPDLDRQRGLLDADDILLTPALPQEATFASFTTLVETIAPGYAATMAQRARLEPLSIDAESYTAYRAAHASPSVPDAPIVRFLQLDNRSRLADSIIAARLDDIAIGAPLDLDAVETAVGKLYGLELFQNVHYQVVDDDRGTGLTIQVEERSWGPSYLQLGMRYDSSSDAPTTFALGTSYLRTLLNEHGGEWRGTVLIGDEPGLFADYYQPLGPRGAFFVEPQVARQSTLYDVFVDNGIAAEIDTRETVAELAGGRELGEAAEVRLGVRSAAGEYRLQAGDAALLPGDGYRRREWFASVTADTLDSP